MAALALNLPPGITPADAIALNFLNKRPSSTDVSLVAVGRRFVCDFQVVPGGLKAAAI